MSILIARGNYRSSKNTERGITMKKMIALVMACLLLLGLCACESGPSLVGSTPSGNNSSTETTSAPADKTFKVGDVVELDDVVVSFIGVTKSTGSDFYKPAEGKVYVLCEFEITNNSDEELAVSSMICFKAYCDDYACDYSLGALMAKGDKDQLDGSVAAGKKMKGVVGYEIPADWKELEIQYTPDLLSSSKIVFVATNN